MGKWFGTDGIRGTVGAAPMVPEFMLQLGRAAGVVIRGEAREATVLIGRDTRASGPMLQEALEAGLMASGVQIINLGIVPTPAVAWLVRYLGVDAGAVISASHNPVDQNGIKFFDRSGRKLPERKEREIEEHNESKTVSSEGLIVHSPLGQVFNGEIFQEFYIRGLLSEHSELSLNGFKIVMDCANGAASFIAPIVFSRLGAEVIAVHASPNGTNINVSAGSEHIRRTMQEMKLLIDHHNARFGLAFDGDADRVVFIDENGKLVDGDHMLGILARYFDRQSALLKRTVVTSTMRNSGLKTFLQDAGISMDETPVGDKYITDRLFELREFDSNEKQIGLGGEQAGHILIIDNDHPTGDGIRTALYVIRALIETAAPSLAELAENVGKTPQIIASAHVGNGERIPRPELDLAEAEIAAEPGIIRVNLRYSGTEPLFRVMLESDNSMSEIDLAQVALKICRKAQQTSGEPAGSVDILNVTSGGVINLT